MVALLKQALPVRGRNRVVCKSAVTGTGRACSREQYASICQCFRGTGHCQPLLVKDGLGDLTVGRVPVASVFWATELKAKGGGREPVLFAHAAKLTGPVSQNIIVMTGTPVDVLKALAVEAGLSSPAAIGATTGGVEPAHIALANGGSS